MFTVSAVERAVPLLSKENTEPVPQTIFIGVAWPYANGPLHLGHVAGCYLPADIFARFHRAQGNRVLMVSGSDMHGTPVTVRADEEGVSPAEVAERYHNSFCESWRQIGISWDLYTHTDTDNHARVAHDIFERLLERDYLHREHMDAYYCASCGRFLPDRYVQGVCRLCGAATSRGDQCEACGTPLETADLLNPVCRRCGGAAETRSTEHFFLDLGQFEQRLREWVAAQPHWRPNVRNFTRNLLDQGLRPRPITRDLEWGVPVPVPGFESKRIYVWFEAVIGYLSASKEWATARGEPDAWREFWTPPTRSYYFIGKDNIPFHTIIWPAMLMGYDRELVLPYDVPANEYLTLERRPFSTSRRWAIWAPDFLSRYDPDPLRYLLSANMPEGGDTDFSWAEFVRRNNDELLANYGNFVHRVLTMTVRNFDGQVPPAGSPGQPEEDILAAVHDTFTGVSDELEHCHFRAAIGRAMELARAANRYLDHRAPWKQLKQDHAAAGATLHTAVQVISALKTMLYPFLPFSSQQVHRMLGEESQLDKDDWRVQSVPAGRRLQEPQPLFKRLDDSIIEQELERLEKQSA
jgi:methionyl-tRNA synthetase